MGITIVGQLSGPSRLEKDDKELSFDSFLTLIDCMTMSKSRNYTDPQFLHFYGEDHRAFVTECL